MCLSTEGGLQKQTDKKGNTHTYLTLTTQTHSIHLQHLQISVEVFQ